MAYVTTERVGTRDAAASRDLELMVVLPLGKYHFITSPSDESVSVYRERNPQAAFGYSPGLAGPQSATDPIGKHPSDVRIEPGRPVQERYLDPAAANSKEDEKAFSGDAVANAIRRTAPRDSQNHPRAIDQVAVRRGLQQAAKARATADEIGRINTRNQEFFGKK